ncbi:DUF4062 domain-containing protein [Stenotrophomonas maltophilia]|nr:DUF4062 domain-containing protein [Stenotrophomonas maltophilia]
MDRKLQVFVSSTFTDLISERQAAVSAILKAGHIPAGMELFTAGDQSQMEIIRRWIDESDVYMLILGGRYGSIEPTSGLSYTELEFDYAVSKSKPLFAVVMKDGSLNAKVKAHGLSVAETENPAALKAFREKVLSNVSSFFEDEKDIRLCVFETLPLLADNKALVGWVRGDQIIDSTPFRLQNESLQKELEEVKAKLAAAERREHSNEVRAANTVSGILAKLRKVKLEVPALVIKREEPWKTDLVDFISANATSLVGGISNSASGSDAEKFIYTTVAPALTLHGLMRNVKLDKQIRGYEMTPFGLEVLAFVDSAYRRMLEEQEKKQSQAESGQANSGSPSSEAQLAATPPARVNVPKKPRKAAANRTSK